MSETVVGANAARSNPALHQLSFLIGEWATEGTHPAFPDARLPGRTSFAWLERGAFMIMRSQTEHPDFPAGLAIFSSDDVLGEIMMSWFDERGVSRLCPVSASPGSVRWHHDDPEFMQRLTITADPDGSHMCSKGEMARNGGTWGSDLCQTFVRMSARQA